MARFTKTVNIWDLDSEQRAALQVGQWVCAGENGPRGRFYGEGSSTVAAWIGNAKGSRDYRGYMSTMHNYGKVVRATAALVALRNSNEQAAA
jgi:hypothetical protein